MNEEWWRMMKDEWRIMKDERWMMKDDDFKLLKGFAALWQMHWQSFAIVESLSWLKSDVFSESWVGWNFCINTFSGNGLAPILHPFFIILHSSFLHSATFKLFSLFPYHGVRCLFYIYDSLVQNFFGTYCGCVKFDINNVNSKNASNVKWIHLDLSPLNFE